jgi:hypothetical protein
MKCKPLSPGLVLRLTVKPLDPQIGTLTSTRSFTVVRSLSGGRYVLSLRGREFELNRDCDLLTGMLHWSVLDFDIETGTQPA